MADVARPTEGFMQKKPTRLKVATAPRGAHSVTTQVAPSRTELAKALAVPSRLPATEEKALRMLHGVQAPKTLVLSRVGQNIPESRTRLLEIELELLRQSKSRSHVAVRKPAAPVAVAATAAANPRRARIVAALKKPR